MSKYAFTSSVAFDDELAEFKRYALLFDKIVVIGLRQFQKNLADPQLLAEVDYLIEQGVLLTADHFKGPGRMSDALRSRYDSCREINAQLLQQHPTSLDALTKLENDLIIQANEHTRIAALAVHEMGEEGVVPLLQSTAQVDGLEIDNPVSPRKANVFRVLYKSVPQIAVDTPWEQIVDFRADDAARQSLLALRVWATEISKGNLSANEIEEKFEYLIRTYERHLAIHRLKSSKGMFEAIILSSAEAIEAAAHLRFSKLAAMLFKVRSQEIELMEAELGAPGAEVAYISRARTQFSTR